ncbi:MAG: CPBP family intramembrane metalloprotease [Desulfurococcales archaeon]|nr:CPBP family intramembrane metalloprotease [Desulfurococcales archaeon]
MRITRRQTGLLVYIAVAFIPAFLLDYTYILEPLKEAMTNEATTTNITTQLKLLAVLVARMWLPAAGTLLALYVEGVRSIEAVKDLVGLKSIEARYIAAAALAPLAVYTLSIPIALGLGGRLGPCKGLQETPYALILLTIPLGVVAGATVNAAVALGEEIGWRGYLVEAIDDRIGFTGKAIVIGVLWGLWHAPLIYYGYDFRIPLPGGCGESSGGVPALLVFTLFTVSFGSILLLLRVRSGSVYAAAIGHGVINGIAGSFSVIVYGNRLLTPPAGLAVSISAVLVAFVMTRLLEDRRRVF